MHGPCFAQHASSEEAEAANELTVVLDSRGGFTPTPAVSRAILAHNATGPAHQATEAGDDLLRVTGLRHPVVRAGAQPANPLGDGRAAGAHHHAETGKRGGHAVEEMPGLLVQEREVHDEGVDPHGNEFLDERSGLEAAMLPPEIVRALDQHAYETGVRIENRQPKRACIRGGHRMPVYAAFKRIPLVLQLFHRSETRR